MGDVMDECPLVVEATDRETARTALHAMKRPGEHVGPMDIDALTILLGRVRADEREKCLAPAARRASPMPSADPDRERGWYRKYTVTRHEDYANKHIDCEYFVLDLDHDKHAPAALRAYAASCAATHPKLSADLTKRFGSAADSSGLTEEERFAILIEEAHEEERGHVLVHLRNAATVARNRAAAIVTNGNADDAKKYKGRAEYLGQLANEIEKGKHLPKGRRRSSLFTSPATKEKP